jgi:hypothetical protein
MPITYEPIATQTLGSTAGSVTFSSIPSTYTDLIVVTSPTATNNNYDIGIRFNSDTGSNYSMTCMVFNADNSANPQSTRETNVSSIRSNTNINNTIPNPFVLQIQNYANTTTFKSTLSRTAVPSGGYGLGATVGLWRSTSAINEITFVLLGGGSTTYKVGSVFTLYGIKAN